MWLRLSLSPTVHWLSEVFDRIPAERRVFEETANANMILCRYLAPIFLSRELVASAAGRRTLVVHVQGFARKCN